MGVGEGGRWEKEVDRSKRRRKVEVGGRWNEVGRSRKVEGGRWKEEEDEGM